MAAGVLLDLKHEQFVQLIATGASITEASAKCGVTRQTGTAWLDRIDVQLRVEEIKMQMVDEMRMTREDVIRGLETIAQADPSELLRINNLQNLTPAQAAAIDTVEITEGNMVVDGCPQPTTTIKIKAVDKKVIRGALQDLGKHHNIFEDHQKSGAGEMTVIIEGKDASL